MATVVNFSLNVEKLPKDKYIKGKKGVYQNITVVINDEVNDFGNNVKTFVTQTQAEREQKVAKTYLGDGRVVWTNGVVNVAKQQQEKENEELTDMPF